MPNPSTDDVSDEVREAVASIELPNAEAAPAKRLDAGKKKMEALETQIAEQRATLAELEGEAGETAGVSKRKRQREQEKNRRRNRRRRERKGQPKKKDASEAGGITFAEAFAKIKAAGKHPIANRRSAARTFASAGVSAEHVDAVLESMNSPREARAQRRRQARTDERKREMLDAVGEDPAAAEEEADGEELMVARNAAGLIQRKYGGVALKPSRLFHASERRGVDGSRDPSGPLVTAAGYGRARREMAETRHQENTSKLAGGRR